MDERTKIALEGSIAKWESIVKGTGIDMGVNNCPLCAVFYRSHNCNGCPVKQRTGRSYCHQTPYQQFNNALFAGQFALAHEYAEKELEFLESLREADDDQSVPVSDQ